MNRIFLTLFFILICMAEVQAVQIVYPKSESVTINSDKTFFVGNETVEPQLLINSVPVNLHSSGAFFHPVELKEGENVFLIDNGHEILTYKIYRKISTMTQNMQKYKEFDSPISFFVDQDNTPLRSVPYDGGLNRLQHLEKGTPLTVVGEYADFYKVRLARDDYAWIAKNSLKKAENFDNKPVKILGYTYDEKPSSRVFTLKLSKKTPYILSETPNLSLVVYNVDGFFENKYEFNINKTSRPFGYKSYFKNQSELVIEVKDFPSINAALPLNGLTVVVDPGHGGSEFGAIGCLGDAEKDINLAISQKLKTILIESGANVVMTRDDDHEVALNDRVKISQNSEADIFLSIHNNALPDSMANSGRSGSSVYWFYPQSKQLAKIMQETLVSELGLSDDKVRGESLAVIRNTHSPAILIEIGYMINPEDNAKLLDPEFQQKAAQAILHGLERYLNVQ